MFVFFLPDEIFCGCLHIFEIDTFFFFSAPYSDRLTMYGNNLRFSKVTRKDSGVFTCEVSANSQFANVKVALTVLGKNLPLVHFDNSYI